MSPIGDKQIPETHLRPLTQVPDDVKKQIWDEVTEQVSREVEEKNQKITAKKVSEAVARYEESLKSEQQKTKVLAAQVEVEKQHVQDWRSQDKEKFTPKRSDAKTCSLKCRVTKSRHTKADSNPLKIPTTSTAIN
ncbi:MAG: hypothetical protein WCP96_08365 [Methylococcaceae bacterium]